MFVRRLILPTFFSKNIFLFPLRKAKWIGDSLTMLQCAAFKLFLFAAMWREIEIVRKMEKAMWRRWSEGKIAYRNEDSEIKVVK